MKYIALFTLLLTSCAQRDWSGTPNPLDTPAYNVVKPESMGNFGPHSEFYNN